MQFGSWWQRYRRWILQRHPYRYLAIFAICLIGGMAWAVTTNVTITVATTFTPLHTYFMAASGCSDANNGTSTSTPWCTPNHAVVCGDVIIAQAGTYNSSFSVWGTVSNCPSASGGIDGTGGIYQAILVCAGDITSCIINCATAPCNGEPSFGPAAGMNINKNNWAVAGWYINGNGVTNFSAIQVAGCSGSVTHHVAIINSIFTNGGQGFTPQDCNASSATTQGGDYVALIGNIAQDSAKNDNGICIAAIDVVAPGKFGSSSTDVHYFIYNNYAWNNLVPGCDGLFDGEDYMADTLDHHGAIGKFIFANNIGYYAQRYCFNFTYGGQVSSNPLIRFYNNTCYANMQRDTAFAGGVGAEIISTANGAPWSVQIFNNIAYEPYATNPQVGSDVLYAMHMNPLSPTTNLQIGAQVFTGYENIFKATQTVCLFTCDSGNNVSEANGTSATYGLNTYVNPDFKNGSHLISSHLGLPNCAGFITTTACLGWDAAMRTMTSLSILDDLTANATGACPQCVGKGFQKAGNCVTSGELFNDYPPWVKGIVYLRASGYANGATITENAGLVTKPCNM